MGSDTQGDRLLPILTYHKIDPKAERFGFTRLSPQRFKRTLEIVNRRCHLSVSSVDELIENPFAKGKVALLFDDAYEDFEHYAYPVLDEFGYRAFLFVITDFIGKQNSWDLPSLRGFPHLGRASILSLSNSGIIIGSHTRSHRALSSLSAHEIRNELSYSKKLLEDITGKPVEAISYPFGDWDERVIDIASETGYRVGFSIAKGMLPFSFLALRSMCVYSFDTDRKIKKKLERDTLELARLRVMNLGSKLTKIYKKQLGR
ncbi:polysaccharide deacetylase family protein [bacterium]|nr:polysaccharide deacetylase family protein [bacterium]